MKSSSTYIVRKSLIFSGKTYFVDEMMHFTLANNNAKLRDLWLKDIMQE